MALRNASVNKGMTNGTDHVGEESNGAIKGDTP
jgi:hypothetical protein